VASRAETMHIDRVQEVLLVSLYQHSASWQSRHAGRGQSDAAEGMTASLEEVQTGLKKNNSG